MHSQSAFSANRLDFFLKYMMLQYHSTISGHKSLSRWIAPYHCGSVTYLSPRQILSTRDLVAGSVFITGNPSKTPCTSTETFTQFYKNQLKPSYSTNRERPFSFVSIMKLNTLLFSGDSMSSPSLDKIFSPGHLGIYYTKSGNCYGD